MALDSAGKPGLRELADDRQLVTEVGIGPLEPFLPADSRRSILTLRAAITGAVGQGALEDYSTGDFNTASGTGALAKNSKGIGNTAIGQEERSKWLGGSHRKRRFKNCSSLNED